MVASGQSRPISRRSTKPRGRARAEPCLARGPLSYWLIPMGNDAPSSFVACTAPRPVEFSRAVALDARRLNYESGAEREFGREGKT